MGFFMFKCKICTKKFNNYDSLRKHMGRIHKINSTNFYIQFYLNNKRPTCKCGCGEFTRFTGPLHGFKEYKQGHISRIKNNWGHNQSAIDKSSETRRQQYKNGERQPWNKGLNKTDKRVLAYSQKLTKENNPERAKNISKALIGIPKSKEHRLKMKNASKKYWSKQKNRDAQRIRRINYMNKYLKINETKLETKFKQILNKLNIEYEFQFKLIKYNYDFYIKNTNIIIEVDSDFWHCNPNQYLNPQHDCQKHTIEHDKIKNKWAKDNNYKLLRFWESDINNNKASVIKKLIKELKI